MDKPRITTNDALDLIAAVDSCQRVGDMGIPALSFIQRWGTCSLHGEVKDEVEVSHGVALAEDKIRCWPCYEQFQVTKKCVVESIGPVERET